MKKHFKTTKNTVFECILEGKIVKKFLACGGLFSHPLISVTNKFPKLPNSFANRRDAFLKVKFQCKRKIVNACNSGLNIASGLCLCDEIPAEIELFISFSYMP